ncbi:hypothetical protein FACS1894156_6660 [Bacteroidia bacterium]|nr:hypothetical protein FACS1894156_6660 [Bacteroidia bacterium]
MDKIIEQIELQKDFALIEEFETASKLVNLGFGELQNINLENDFYFLPFQLLSQGFERFLKAYICVGYFEKHNTLPSSQYLKNLGHDLNKLLTEIKEKYYNKDLTRKQFELDWTFLNEDTDFKKLFNILSEFGKYARYYNFDLITGKTDTGINPKEAWQKFENKIMPLNEEKVKKIMNPDTYREVYYETSNRIIIIFEKFISALSRQMIFKTLGDNGYRFNSNSFFDYGMIYDGEFGKMDYRKNTTKYKEQARHVHKRTIIDELKRKFHPDYKSKKIFKSEYKGEWAFYADKVIIECRQKHWCIVTINGYDYALNGSAYGRYKLERPHEAGMAILGKSISDFVTMALNL